MARERRVGIVALVLVSLSVFLGLAMAAKMLGRPSLKRAAARLHEHVVLAALAAIAVHGLALLGDHWLKPGWRGITIPFALNYKPGITGIGIIAATSRCCSAPASTCAGEAAHVSGESCTARP